MASLRSGGQTTKVVWLDPSMFAYIRLVPIQRSSHAIASCSSLLLVVKKVYTVITIITIDVRGTVQYFALELKIFVNLESKATKTAHAWTINFRGGKTSIATKTRESNSIISNEEKYDVR